MSDTKLSLADRLPFGAGNEIERRLKERGGESVRSISHISRVLSGERDDPIVEDVAADLIKERWTRRRSKNKKK